MASPSRKLCTYSNPPQQNRQHDHRLQKDSDCLWWNDWWYRSNGPEMQWELILRVWKRYDMSTFHRRIYRVRTYKLFNSLLLSMEMWVTFTIMIWYQHYCANVCLVLYVPIKWDRTFRLWVVILDPCTLILRISIWYTMPLHHSWCFHSFQNLFALLCDVTGYGMSWKW